MQEAIAIIEGMKWSAENRHFMDKLDDPKYQQKIRIHIEVYDEVLAALKKQLRIQELESGACDASFRVD